MATEKRLIDANALIESGHDVKMDEVFPNWAESPDSTKEAVCKHGQYLKKLINEQPTVDAVEVVHGNWVYYSTSMQECSNCKRHTARHKFKYCPYCGAVMGDKLHYAID